MTSKQEQAARLLDLPAHDYFAFSEDQQVKLEDALTELTTAGAPPRLDALPAPVLAVGAPKRVNLDKQSSMPVLVGSVQSGLRAWQVNFRPNLHLVLRNLSTGALSVSQPLVSVRRGSPELASGKGSPPDKLTAATVYSSVERINLRERMSDALIPGTFSLTAIANDLPSNTVQIHVEGSSAAQPSKAPTQQPYVRHRLESRAMPDTVVQVPKSVSADDDILVRIAMQISDDAGVLQAPAEPLLPTHVILVKLDERPHIIPAWVPIQRIGTAPRPAYNAVFQVDVRAALKASLTGTYQVYIDVGHSVLGPYPLTVAQ